MSSLYFIGGWGTGEEVWRGVLEELGSRLSGKGGCEGGAPAGGETGPPTFVSWLECIEDWPGVLARLAAVPNRFVLVGWSLGSVLALRAVMDSAAAAREKVAAMVLVSATSCMCARHEGADVLSDLVRADGYAPTDGAPAAGPGHGGIEPRVLAAMRARMRRSPEAVLEDFAAECAAPDGNEATRQSWLGQARKFSGAQMIAGLDALASLDVRDRLGEVAVPCRILHGECDRIVPLRSAQFLAQRIRGAGLQVLKGRGHALPLTAAAEIAQCIASCE